jgi:glycerol-3-phosphate acyltransferase PlsY
MPGLAESMLVPAAYALGCATAAYYLVRLRAGVDVRTLGSGTAGSRNAGRVLGRGAFATAFVLDFAKGALAAGAAAWFAAGVVVSAGATLAVVAGHVWPAQLGFRGGKGIATSLGAFAVYEPLVFVSLLGSFLVVYAFVRRFTVAGMAAYALAPLGGLALGAAPAKAAAAWGVAAIVIFAHRDALRRGVDADSARSDDAR